MMLKATGLRLANSFLLVSRSELRKESGKAVSFYDGAIVDETSTKVYWCPKKNKDVTSETKAVLVLAKPSDVLEISLAVLLRSST